MHNIDIIIIIVPVIQVVNALAHIYAPPCLYTHTHTHTHTHTQASLDSGNPSISPDANVHDVASLLKQYLRELPEPLITAHLLPVFEACYSLPTPVDRQRCLLLACLFLPQIHLEVRSLLATITVESLYN